MGTKSTQLCQCGCGRKTTICRGRIRKFVSGHNSFLNKGKTLGEIIGKKKAKITRAKMSKNNCRYWFGKTGKQAPRFGKSPSKETREKIRLASIGRVLSNETRLKMSKSRMGKKNCNWGKHFSKETRKKMAKARIGKYRGKNHPMWRKRHSKEAIEKMKKIHKGQKGHGLGQTYEEYYGKNRAKEIKKKMKIAGVRKSKIYRGKNHWNFGKHLSIKTRMLIGKANKGKIISKKTRAKISLATSGDNNPSKHSGVGKKISATKRKQWENPLFVKKMLKAFAIRPNKPEKKLIGILRKHFPKDYKYTGDGKHGGFFGKAPDFANKKSKEFLEIFGRHWHEPEEEKERIAHFKKFGWDTLIIWEEELKNEEKLLERIKEFRGDGKDG